MTDNIVKFKNETSYKGRNGLAKLTGMEVMQTLGNTCVMVSPVNTKCVSSTWTEINKEDLPAFIKQLQKCLYYKDRLINGHCVADFLTGAIDSWDGDYKQEIDFSNPTDNQMQDLYNYLLKKELLGINEYDYFVACVTQWAKIRRYITPM